MNKELDLLLIRLVKATPILYDKTKFSDYNEREVAWQKIGDKLHRPALECKERWMSMREFFRSTTLKMSADKPNGRTTKRKPYKYHKELLFLVAHYKNGIVNLEDLGNRVDVNDKSNLAKDDDDDEDFPVTFDIEGPDIPDILNDVDELKDDDSDTKEDEIFNDVDELKNDDDSDVKEDDNFEMNNFSEDSTEDVDRIEENFKTTVTKQKSNIRKRKKAVNTKDKDSLRARNKIIELNPSNATDNFLIDIRARMKKLSRSKVDKVKSKIYSIISHYE